MARPLQFDRARALLAAVAVFADHGFEGSSTEQLLEAMGISRQSLYNTFGDKRALYLEALARYQADSVGAYVRTLNTASSPLEGIAAVLLQFAARPAKEAATGCLGVGAICELGRADAEVASRTDVTSRELLAAFERRLADAAALGEIEPSIDHHEAAQFLIATLTGMKVSARAGATPKALRGIAMMALRSLR